MTRARSGGPPRPLGREELLRQLEGRLEYRWRQRPLLYQALRHPAAVRGNRLKSNQRLEFLGDAVLDGVVAVHLMQVHPEADEGFLTELRARMVREDNLADKGTNLGLRTLVEVPERDLSLRDLKSTVADAMEAVIASAFTDSGYDFAVAYRTVMNAGILG